ncbi:MAG: SirB2 family protein [Psychromonas sp.]|nr:SirB2 family protein [Alteromonadales bacterium]MCP5077391.1 SirB2 family protein [Psychromonas sp.]
MDYLLIKHLHITMAYLSISLFIFRSILSIRSSTLLQHKLLKILPHIIDTLLLSCAILLMITIQQYPFVNSWLTAKLIALLTYIVVGTIAIKRGKTAVIRFWATIISVVIFSYIVAVAKAHNAMFWVT